MGVFFWIPLTFSLYLFKYIFKNRLKSILPIATARRATSNILVSHFFASTEACNILYDSNDRIWFSSRFIVVPTREKKFIAGAFNANLRTWDMRFDRPLATYEPRCKTIELKGGRRISVHDNTFVLPSERGGRKKSIFSCLLSSRWINVRFVITSTDVRVDDTR